MDEPRLPALHQGAVSGTDERVVSPEVIAEGGAEELVDRSGMLPRENGVKAKEADEGLALLLAKQLYPNLTHIDQITDKQEKAWWTLVAGQILRGQEAITRYVESFSKVFQPSVDAQVADTLRKGAAEELERTERKARLKELHAVALAHQEKAVESNEKHWGLRERAIKQRLEQEKVREANGEKIERILMVMMVIAFALAVALIVAAAVAMQINDSPSPSSYLAIAGGSGGLGLFSAIALMLHRTRRTRIDADSLLALISPPANPPSPPPEEAANEAAA